MPFYCIYKAYLLKKKLYAEKEKLKKSKDKEKKNKTIKSEFTLGGPRKKNPHVS